MRRIFAEVFVRLGKKAKDKAKLLEQDEARELRAVELGYRAREGNECMDIKGDELVMRVERQGQKKRWEDRAKKAGGEERK